MNTKTPRIVLALLTLAAITASAQTNANFKRTEDVIYGRKFGTALTLDVFQPAQPNGAAIISLVSGGWFSSHEGVNPAAYRPFLNRGYTVFAVVHCSQPKFTVTEIVPDIHRAIRFIRHNAARYGVDPARFGVTGGSAGGHLSLTMGTQGGPGDSKAKDPIDRESSAVQCVACFFPPTDFLNYGQPCEDAVGVGILKNFKPAFGSRCDTPEDRQKL
jgi:acetyl esterase/lipase